MPFADRPSSFASADMAVPFLLVIFLGGAFADVMKTDPSQCDMESPSFLQLKHQGEQARQDTLQLLMLVSGGHSGPGAVFKCNVDTQSRLQSGLRQCHHGENPCWREILWGVAGAGFAEAREWFPGFEFCYKQ